MIKKALPRGSTSFLIVLVACLLSAGLAACGGSGVPAPQTAVIEQTAGGEEILDREFGPCDSSEPIDDNELVYQQYRPVDASYAAQQQQLLEQSMPHQYASLEQMFPLRGSWRQSKAEIMDLVDRKIWSPERQQSVDLLDYFDLVLLVNVAPRLDSTPENHSSQRMQVLVRKDSSNQLQNWTRSQVWPISSGRYCGQKIETPTGVYKFDKDRIYAEYLSNQFENAQGEKPNMYETMFLYSQYQDQKMTGVAVHGTYLTDRLGRRDSGGCLRLHRDNSKCLFDSITGNLASPCLTGGQTDYRGQVPSLVAKNGEADPEYYGSPKKLEISGYRVLVVIFNDVNDVL